MFESVMPSNLVICEMLIQVERSVNLFLNVEILAQNPLIFTLLEKSAKVEFKLRTSDFELIPLVFR